MKPTKTTANFFFNFWLLLCGFLKNADAVNVDNCECGVSNFVANRIVGGDKTSIDEYPWMVYITESSSLSCGGTLINDRYVLTAGHCVAWTQVENLAVVLGRTNTYSNEGIVVKVMSIRLHEDFTSDPVHDTNDIALLKLMNPVRFGKTILPICLPNPLSEYTNREATIAGWGTIASGGDISSALKVSSVKILHDDKCIEIPEIRTHYADSMMCAYAPETDACQGDSGGPMFFKNKNSKSEIIGITSWGLGCASENIPGLYTKVVNFLSWIYWHANDGVYCKYN